MYVQQNKKLYRNLQNDELNRRHRQEQSYRTHGPSPTTRCNVAKSAARCVDQPSPRRWPLSNATNNNKRRPLGRTFTPPPPPHLSASEAGTPASGLPLAHTVARQR